MCEKDGNKRGVKNPCEKWGGLRKGSACVDKQFVLFKAKWVCCGVQKTNGTEYGLTIKRGCSQRRAERFWKKKKTAMTASAARQKEQVGQSRKTSGETQKTEEE